MAPKLAFPRPCGCLLRSRGYAGSLGSHAKWRLHLVRGEIDDHTGQVAQSAPALQHQTAISFIPDRERSLAYFPKTHLGHQAQYLLIFCAGHTHVGVVRKGPSRLGVLENVLLPECLITAHGGLHTQYDLVWPGGWNHAHDPNRSSADWNERTEDGVCGSAMRPPGSLRASRLCVSTPDHSESGRKNEQSDTKHVHRTIREGRLNQGAPENHVIQLAEPRRPIRMLHAGRPLHVAHLPVC